jgi:hypothetical protein
MSHTVIKIYNFGCDGPGCCETIEVAPPAGTIKAAFDEITAGDWTVWKGRQFCPDHGSEVAA